MVSNNSAIVPGGNSLDDEITGASGGAEARRDMASSGGSWHESKEDRERFQRFAASNRRSAKTQKVVIDGFIRYADKSYSSKRPRPPSPEYLAFRAELAAAKKHKEIF